MQQHDDFVLLCENFIKTFIFCYHLGHLPYHAGIIIKDWKLYYEGWKLELFSELSRVFPHACLHLNSFKFFCVKERKKEKAKRHEGKFLCCRQTHIQPFINDWLWHLFSSPLFLSFWLSEGSEACSAYANSILRENSTNGNFVIFQKTKN